MAGGKSNMMPFNLGPGLMDSGSSAPDKTGAAKAAARSTESKRDQAMHSAPTKRGGEQRSGMEQAMGAQADQLHPVKRG
jgi:hypothetical protein